MKAASSEWYNTTTRHVLPVPTSSYSSSSSRASQRQSQRLFHGATSSSYGPSSTPPSHYLTSSFNSGVSKNPSTSTSSQQRSLSIRSTGSSINNSSSIPSTRRKPYSFSKSRSSQSSSTATATGSFSLSSSTEPTTSSSLLRQYPSTSLDRRSDELSSYNKYKGGRLLYPGGLSSSSYLTSSFPRISETEGETDVGYTEQEEEEEEDYATHASQPTDEASTEEDDDDVYTSFKDSLRMLRVQQSYRRSTSPAVSLRSVLTELEEDEEELPPDQVEYEAQTTTEEEEDEEEARSSSASGTTASYGSKSVPKSPVKVRVKVEKASSSDRDDDRVKVTVQLESEETELSEEEEEEDDSEEGEEEDEDTEGTEDTAQTVRYRHRHSTRESRTDEDDDESDDYGDEEEDSESGESESELLSEVPDEKHGKRIEKTDSRILNPPPPYLGNPYRNVSSLGDMPHRVRSGIGRSPAGRSHTIHEIHSRKPYSESKKSDSSTSNNAIGPPATTQPNHNTSPSETSSRSQSARASAVGRTLHTHKMYSLGGRLRSLSARRSALPPPSLWRNPHLPPPSPIQQLSTEESSNNYSRLTTVDNYSCMKKSTSSSSSSDPLKNMPDTSSSTHYILSKFASLASPPKPSPPWTLPQLRSLSASKSSSRLELARLRQQRSLGNITTLPPIVTTSSSQSSSTTSSSLSKPRPLLRNDTYTVLDPSHSHHSQDLSEHLPGPFSPPEYVHPCVGEHLAMHQLMSEMSAMSTAYSSSVSSAPTSVPVPLPYDSFMTASLSFRRDPSSQMSFASYALDHSMSSNNNIQSESHQSTSTQLSGSASVSTNGDEEEALAAHERERADREREWRDEMLLNKDVITFGDLDEESADEEEKAYMKKDKLKKFALATIRKKMAEERKRLATIEMYSDGESEEEDEEEDDDEIETSSEEEEPTAGSSKKKLDSSHIPVPTVEIGSDEARPPPERMKSRESGDTSAETSIHINHADEAWDWKKDLKRDFEGDEDRLETPVPSRPATAESGYRALPPTRIGSAKASKEHSVDSELEREKDELLKEWKRSGAVGSPPRSAMSRTDSFVTTGIDHTTESAPQSELIQGGIDLNIELPGEEKKLALVWDEFNKDERSGGAVADYEFSSLLDEMIQDVNSYKPRLSTSGINAALPSHSLQVQGTRSVYEVPKFEEDRKYQSLSELVSLLSHNLRMVSSETLEDHMASLISLISSVLRKVRKNKTEDDYTTQIACLSAIRVLCDRLQEMKNSQNLKYADLSWLFRVLCKYSSDSESKIKPEASFCLARLVRVAGPALVVRPIYFILVMESEGGTGKTTTGAKTKAAAIDTLTYAMLTFPAEEFHNLEEIAGWVCLAMLNEERRIRQSALECLAIISQHMGGKEKAIPLFHTLFLKEELDHFSRSPSPESFKTHKTGKSHKSGKGSEPIGLSVHGTVRLLTGPGFPIAQPIDAITARLEKDILPVPSTKGLIEYAVNVPTGKDLVLLMTHMLDKDDDEWDFSSSTDSMDSGSASLQSKRSSVSSIGFSDIDWTGEGQQKDKKQESDELISPDVAYILLGKGRVNKQEVVLLDTYKKEIIPEIIQMLNRKNMGKRKNRKRYGKQKGRRRRRRGQKREEGPSILDEDVRPRPRSQPCRLITTMGT